MPRKAAPIRVWIGCEQAPGSRALMGDLPLLERVFFQRDPVTCARELIGFREPPHPREVIADVRI